MVRQNCLTGKVRLARDVQFGFHQVYAKLALLVVAKVIAMGKIL
jgi:hypothetical protein